jgi:hypothetical protein
MLTFMTRAQAVRPILTVDAEKPLHFVPEWVQYGVTRKLTSRHIENSHPVVYSLVDNKVFKFDAI